MIFRIYIVIRDSGLSLDGRVELTLWCLWTCVSSEHKAFLVLLSTTYQNAYLKKSPQKEDSDWPLDNLACWSALDHRTLAPPETDSRDIWHPPWGWRSRRHPSKSFPSFGTEPRRDSTTLRKLRQTRLVSFDITLSRDVRHSMTRQDAKRSSFNMILLLMHDYSQQLCQIAYYSYTHAKFWRHAHITHKSYHDRETPQYADLPNLR